MPHSRQRHAIVELLRKLKFSRIVSIQGPRQCGKSFLARDILNSKIDNYQYVTLDVKDQRVFAQKNPATFLSQFKDARTLAIDEVQKSPDLFDELKAKVDINNQPGQFLLLGSTEFSREVLVKESLTGRLSRMRMFPLNSAEAYEIDPNSSAETHLLNKTPRLSRDQLMKFLQRGGFPGIFSIRSDEERESRLQEWIEVTAYRDLAQFKKIKTDPELAIEILEAIATLDFPSQTEIHRLVKRDLRAVKKHLDLLVTLFAITKIPAHRLGTGKEMYYLCDPALVTRLGGKFARSLQTWVLLELQSQASYQGRFGLSRKLHYYRSTKKAFTDFVVETPKETLLLRVHPEETWRDQDLRALRACADQFKSSSVRSVFLFGGSARVKLDSLELFPWESLA